MKRSIFCVVAIISLISCNSHKDIETYERLHYLDSVFVLPDQYYETLNPSPDIDLNGNLADSLNLFNESDLSRSNKAYFYILKTAASFDKSSNHTVNTSKEEIDFSIRYYKRKGEHTKELRAILTKGIKNLHSRDDSLAMAALDLCEKRVGEYNIQDSNLKASIYLAKSRVFRMIKDYPDALLYLDKSYSIFDSLRLHNEKSLVRLDKVSLLLATDRFDESLMLLDSLSKTDVDLPVRKSIYGKYVSYYTQLNKIDSIIQYTRKKENIDRRLKGDAISKDYYHKYSILYRQKGRLDSALYYANLSIKSATDDSSKYLFSNYQSLANIYENTGNYKLASEYYAKAFNSYSDYIINKKIKDIQQRKEEEIKQIYKDSKEEEKRMKILNRLIIVSAIFLVIIASTVFIFIMVLHNVISNKRKAEEKYENTQIIQQVLSTTIGLLPEITTELSKVVNQSAKYSPEMFDILNSILNNFKVKFRSNISNIVSSNSFQKQNKTINGIQELSNQEKLITTLYEKGYTPSQIADFLGLSQGSIRACKSRIRLKLMEKYNPLPKEIRLLKIMR